MTNINFVKNVRKIAKTDELQDQLNGLGIPKFVDKSRIPGRRGVGIFEPDKSLDDTCQLGYSSAVGVYSFASIVDGTSGLKPTDGKYSYCVQVNTITQMTECETAQSLTLKPDGIFTP